MAARLSLGADLAAEEGWALSARYVGRFGEGARDHGFLLGGWLIVYEPTGAYHGALERALAAAGLPLVKVNLRQARRFAEASGRLANTDRIDAEGLARMGAALVLAPRPLPGRDLQELKELQLARRALIAGL